MTDQSPDTPLSVLKEILAEVREIKARSKPPATNFFQNFDLGDEDPREIAERVVREITCPSGSAPRSPRTMDLEPGTIEIPEGQYRLDKTPAGYHLTDIPPVDPAFSTWMNETIKRILDDERAMQESLPALPVGYRWKMEISPTEYDFDGRKAVFTTSYRVVSDLL